MSDRTEDLLKEVKQELGRISDDVKSTAEEALKQAKDAGKLTEETKAKADEVLSKQTQLEAAQKALEARQLELEQKSLGVRDEQEKPKTLGQAIVAHEQYKAFVQGGCRGTSKIDVQNAITSATGSAGGLIWSDRETEIVGLPRRQLTIRSLLRPGRTGSNMVEYSKQTVRTNNANVVSEGAQKPESNYVWEKADAPVRTIAHWVPVSRQAMDDAAQLETEIDGELRYGLDLKEELEILKGDGTGEHLSGLVTEATAFAPAFAVANETPIDTLRLALLQASLAEYPADGIVLHPTDWARIELTKDGEQRYIFANVLQLAGPTLWGRPVVSTQSMDVAEFLVGAFMAAAQLYDRMATEVVISSEDRDNFIKNMLTVRAEKRLALAVKRPAALITGEFQYAS